MDATDLDHRARTRSGCIPPELVSRLLERGHADVVEQQAGRGEWFCALAWARLLGERARQADACEVLAPYLATGWWTAVVAAAELLEGWGRVDEAIEITRVRVEAGHPMALEFYTRLLARHGRAEEAFALLRPHIGELSLATALVDVAAAAGRHEEAAALLAPRAEHECSDFPWCCRGLSRDMTTGLLATLLERQGRVDEAIALLHTDRTTTIDHREQLAALLARHGRLDELRAAAAADDSWDAVRQLAGLLEERGDVEGAVAAYRQAVESTVHAHHAASEQARLLARHGRGGEAIEMLRVQTGLQTGLRTGLRTGDDRILHALSDLCLDQGRPHDGLVHLDAFATVHGGEEDWESYRLRLRLIAARDGVDEAIARARSHPEGRTSYAAQYVAELLTGAGRIEEAVVVLEQHAPANSHDLAACLIDLGRVEDALAVLERHTPRQAGQPDGRWRDESPF
ncbi:tetratricopeptide repeat protein [Streptomyces zaomyceticus]|uniref:tetratricopeptide repeat protein n=1 Tax=Streptomyces zaomyceticus TaxID=68286 RepID=UPI003436170D